MPDLTIIGGPPNVRLSDPMLWLIIAAAAAAAFQCWRHWKRHYRQ